MMVQYGILLRNPEYAVSEKLSSLSHPVLTGGLLVDFVGKIFKYFM